MDIVGHMMNNNNKEKERKKKRMKWVNEIQTFRVDSKEEQTKLSTIILLSVRTNEWVNV